MNFRLGSIALAALMACALPITAAAQKAALVKMRYLSFSGSVQPHELAQELGYFEGTGIELESKGYVTGGPEMLMAMATGSIDVTPTATPAMLNAIEAGNDFVASYPTTGIDENVQSKFYVLEGSSIKDIKDLVGKTIAINSLGAHLDFVLREALRKAGVPANSVKLVSVPTPQLEQVLRSGQVDVSAVGNWVTNFQGEMEKNGGVRVLFKDTDIIGNLSGGFAALRRDFIKANPEAAKNFTLESARAIDFSRENLAEARKLVAKILKRRGENAEIAQYFLGYGVRKGALGTLHDVQFWIDLMEREGQLTPGKIDARKIMFMTMDDIAEGKK